MRDATSAPPGPRGIRPRSFYVELWRTVPRELASHVVGAGLALVGALVVGTLLVLALGLAGVLVGFLLVPLALMTARGLASASRRLVAFSGRATIVEPAFGRPPPHASAAAYALYGPVLDGHYWLCLLHAAVVAPPVALVIALVSLGWAVSGVGGTLLGLVTVLSGGDVPTQGPVAWTTRWLASVLGLPEPPVPLVVAVAVASTLFFAATLPFVTRGLTVARAAVDRLLLGPWSSDALRLEVVELSASRGAAVVAEDRALRRLERDIHDGPQQRLIRVQMDLAAAERRIVADPAAAALLVGEAREHVRSALEELRALSRGVAPPILQDRGVIAAVSSLGELCPVPLAVEDRLGGAVLPPEIERSLYFVVSELVTNAVKHAGATSIRVHLALRTEVPHRPWLDTWVIDDGVGGAAPVPGHGLEGVAERVRGLRGQVLVRSAPGRGTTVGVHVPLPG